MLRLAERQLNVKLEIYIYIFSTAEWIEMTRKYSKGDKKNRKEKKVILDQIKMYNLKKVKHKFELSHIIWPLFWQWHKWRSANK